MARVYRELHFVVAAVVLFGTSGFAQISPTRQVSAGELVRAVIANELKPQANAARWMYQLEKEEAGTVQSKEVIETRDGSLDKVTAVNGKSLTPEQQRKEVDRIVKLAQDPEQRRKLEQARRKDEEQCRNFLQMIPDAFAFSYAEQDGDFVKVKFTPNPKFQPPSREARVLHELEGEMWLHATQQRLANISGHLVNEVKFGGGLLGHLEKGGQFVVKRDEVAPGKWEMTAMEIEMKGKILLFKNIAVQQRERHNNFRPISDDLTLADAADLLTKHMTVAAYLTDGTTAEK
jgi:hypothetical protein